MSQKQLHLIFEHRQMWTDYQYFSENGSHLIIIRCSLYVSSITTASTTNCCYVTIYRVLSLITWRNPLIYFITLLYFSFHFITIGFTHFKTITAEHCKFSLKCFHSSAVFSEEDFHFKTNLFDCNLQEWKFGGNFEQIRRCSVVTCSLYH